MKYSEGKVGRIFVIRLEDGDKMPDAVEFFAKAPTVSSTKMYVMHVLGTGSTTVSPTYSIGPLGETVLQVCPSSGCP